MKIGIIGAGFVGLTLGIALASKKYAVLINDSDPKKIELIKSGVSPFYEPKLQPLLKKVIKKSLHISTTKQIISECDFVFITVGTPISQNKDIDLSYIRNVIDEIGKSLISTKNKPILIIKSTVTPGTTCLIKEILDKKLIGIKKEKYTIITNPEFLREGKALDDTLNPHLILIGCEKKEDAKKLSLFYKNLYKKTIPLLVTNTKTAEMIKYANNAFLATKISFINQIANICQYIPGVNIDDISKAIGTDPRIGDLFLNAGPGFGGSCLPKDVKALISFFNMHQQSPTLLDAVIKLNEEQISNIVKILKRNFKKLIHKKITILGLSFKENTDDIRESSSIKLIKLLLKYKVKIVTHDPKATKNTQKIFGRKISYANSLIDAFNKSDCVILMTPWKEYQNITNKNIQLMNNKIIIDTRRIWINKKFNAKYYALGLGNETNH